MAEQEVRELVWQAAAQILESGQYPTRDLVCSKISKSPREVSPLFAEWRKANPRSAVAAQRAQVRNNQVEHWSSSQSLWSQKSS